MKKNIIPIIVISILLILHTSLVASAWVSRNAPIPTKNKTIVYATKTEYGVCYHAFSDCAKRLKKLTYAEAKKYKLRPCKKCYKITESK